MIKEIILFALFILGALAIKAGVDHFFKVDSEVILFFYLIAIIFVTVVEKRKHNENNKTI